MNDIILEFKDFSAGFRQKGYSEGQPLIHWVVQGLQATIRKGSFVCMVGESGSGKTVTALSVCRLIPQILTRGHIHYFDSKSALVKLESLNEKEFLKIRGHEVAYIFQDPGTSLNPVMKIKEQLLEIRGAQESSVEAMLQSVNIRDTQRVLESYPHMLSGGMKQRIMIASALLGGARLLIADEPTTALDVNTEQEILSLLVDLRKRRGTTILFITHDLPLALEYADEVFVMQKGCLVETLSRNSHFKMEQPYTQRLFGAEILNRQPKSMIEESA